MARRPDRRSPESGPAPVDPPWIDDARPTREPPPPIEPDWATEPDEPLPPIEPDWATDEPDAPLPPYEPSWAAEPDADEAALRAALEEKEPPDPPWAQGTATPTAETTPIDPPWAEDLPSTTAPPEPIEPDWAKVEPEDATVDLDPVDPPWASEEATRGPVILRGPIDPPWVPDDVSEAIEAEEAESIPFEPDWAAERDEIAPLKPIEPDWVDDPRYAAPQAPTPYDPDWEATSTDPPPPIEPDWAVAAGAETETNNEALFDPDWEETPASIDDVPLPPVEPSWAVEVDSEVEQARSDPFEDPANVDDDVIEPDAMVVRGGARRLRDLLSRASLNPFGRTKRAEAARQEDRAKLIADAMRIRSETREALGEETVNTMYRALMGTDPPDEEK